MQLSSISFAYPEVGGTARADLARRLRRVPLPGTFVLATCLRLEIAVAGGPDALDQAIAAAFDPAPEAGSGQVRSGQAAAHHLFRVAAGLESPILGEHEILTQFRQTVLAAEEAGAIDGLFAKLLETAVSVGRSARELLPGSPHDSLAAVAAQAVGTATRVAVFGSGTIAHSVVHGLLGLPAPPDVTIVARRPDKVAIPGVDVWSFDRAQEALAGFPAVVSATSAKRRLVPEHELTGLLAARDTPLTLVDMAMPPDFAPPPGSPIDYLDIDVLARMASRRVRSDKADALVAAAAADAYRRVSDHHALGPVIGELMRTADGIVGETVERFAAKLKDEADRAVLRQTAHTVARKLLADPVAYLQSPDRRPEAVDTIAEAFGLEDG